MRSFDCLSTDRPGPGFRHASFRAIPAGPSVYNEIWLSQSTGAVPFCSRIMTAPDLPLGIRALVYTPLIDPETGCQVEISSYLAKRFSSYSYFAPFPLQYLAGRSSPDTVLIPLEALTCVLHIDLRLPFIDYLHGVGYLRTEKPLSRLPVATYRPRWVYYLSQLSPIRFGLLVSEVEVLGLFEMTRKGLRALPESAFLSLALLELCRDNFALLEKIPAEFIASVDL